MKLKKATDYAFLVLSYLGRIPFGENTNNKEVARACNIPESFLANIVHSLSKSGIITTRKGINGGISLAKSSSEITLREVIEAIEGNIGLVDCLKSEGVCQLENACSVKCFWNVQNEKILAPLNETTMKDLINFSKTVPKRCLEEAKK